MAATSFSSYFGLGKTQAELDFVDVPVDADIPLFIDPFAIAQRPEIWSRGCHDVIVAFFDRVVTEIRSGNAARAYELLRSLREPNETRFGFSQGRPRGAGIGLYQAKQLLESLQKSTAVRTGFLRSLEECELMVEGVGRDKISDLTTNIIRGRLAEYTTDQCQLLKVPLRHVALNPYFDVTHSEWVHDYFDLPVACDRPVLLVPKVIARYDPAYDYKGYYQDVVLEFLIAEQIEGQTSLVRTLKSGRQRVFKKDVAAILPCTKENLFTFSKRRPEALRQYKEGLEKLEKRGVGVALSREEEMLVANSLRAALKSILPGDKDAHEYHKLMAGILEFLFFPNLLCPRLEREIHDGRKRIDIAMENGAWEGIFHRLSATRGLPCSYVFFECKNYSRDIQNPELDQMSGRFSPRRGQLGFVCCRAFRDRSRFVDRCRDTFRDQRGLVIALDDEIIMGWLRLVHDNDRQGVDGGISHLVDEVWLEA